MIFFDSGAMDKPCTWRWRLCLVLAIALSGCAGLSGGVAYDPFRCDRNGEESQRRSC